MLSNNRMTANPTLPVALLCASLAFACGDTDTAQDTPLPSDTEDHADLRESEPGDPDLLQEYPLMDDPFHILQEVEYDAMLALLDGPELAVVYFGWGTCPWCARYVPYFNSVAKAEGLEVLWKFNIRDTRGAEEDAYTGEWRLTPAFQAIVDRVGDENIGTIDRPQDCEGEACTTLPWFTVPSLFVMKDGNLLASRIGAISGHVRVDGELPPLTEEQEAQLVEELEALFRIAMSHR